MKLVDVLLTKSAPIRERDQKFRLYLATRKFSAEVAGEPVIPSN